MATLPIHLEVEDIAVGPVMIALQKMPGIIRMDLKLPDTAPRPARQPGEPKGSGNMAHRIAVLLAARGGGPVSMAEMLQELGGIKSSMATAITKAIAMRAIKRVGRGMYELTDKARRGLLSEQPMKLLPKPAAAAAARNGHDTIKRLRAPRGETAAYVLELLKSGSVGRAELIGKLSERGMNEKSVSSLLKRMQNRKLAKSDGHGTWELTAKGRQQTGAEA